MDSIVETVVWVALFGGTGLIILIELPRIVIWCLEIVERLQKVRFHKRMFTRRDTGAKDSAAHPHKGPPQN